VLALSNARALGAFAAIKTSCLCLETRGISSISIAVCGPSRSLSVVNSPTNTLCIVIKHAPKGPCSRRSASIMTIPRSQGATNFAFVSAKL